MIIPEFDKDGYPTDNTLKAISNWPFKDDLPGLIEFLRAAWMYPERFVEGLQSLELHTGGWSGNEDIIRALQENVFWHLYWQRSERGGHHYFEFKK